MAINANNKTIKITLSKKQVAWLEKTSTKLKVSKSKLIKWSLSRTVDIIINSKWINEKDWEEIQRIAHINWIDED